MKICALFIAFFYSNLLQAKDYVFIGSYNRHNSDRGIYVYTLDTATGEIQLVTSAGNLLNPAYITLSPDGKYVYACTEALIPGGGKVSSFRFSPSEKTITLINDRKSEGENPVYLTVHKNGNWLVNANYTAGNVSVYPLAADGSIQPPRQVLTFTGSGPNTARQQSPHIHAVVFSPGDSFLLAPDLGADKIRCFSFDMGASEPLQPAATPYTASVPGSGPRHLVFHPDGQFCYSVEELSGTIAAYNYNNGALRLIQTATSYRKASSGGYHSADIHISPDGLFLYASNRVSENTISIFAINRQTGFLTLVDYHTTHGKHPRNFSIDPSGKLLLVANQESGTVVVFKRDIKSGKLTDTRYRAKIPGASCIQIRNYTN